MARPKLLVDAWAWIALYNPHDQHHERASAAHPALVKTYDWVTTNFILAETYTALRRWGSPARAVGFGRRIQTIAATGALEVITLAPELESRAWQLFERYDTVSDLSYTDCTTFAVMQWHDITVAFTGDAHFHMLGFNTKP